MPPEMTILRPLTDFYQPTLADFSYIASRCKSSTISSACFLILSGA